MPKATLEFSLPEEAEEHKLAVNASRYHSALWEFSEWLRSREKHGSPSRDAYEELETIRAEFWEVAGGLLDE